MQKLTIFLKRLRNAFNFSNFPLLIVLLRWIRDVLRKDPDRFLLYRFFIILLLHRYISIKTFYLDNTCHLNIDFKSFWYFLTALRTSIGARCFKNLIVLANILIPAWPGWWTFLNILPALSLWTIIPSPYSPYRPGGAPVSEGRNRYPYIVGKPFSTYCQ